jgi:hypothetical protein
LVTETFETTCHVANPNRDGIMRALGAGILAPKNQATRVLQLGAGRGRQELDFLFLLMNRHA